jgi:hypothetical protein
LVFRENGSVEAVAAAGGEGERWESMLQSRQAERERERGGERERRRRRRRRGNRDAYAESRQVTALHGV